MEEELNEHDLEERLYAMLHHVDETQNNVVQDTQSQNDATKQLENGPRGTMRRYWRTGAENNTHQKINNPKVSPPAVDDKVSDNNKPKGENLSTPDLSSSVDISVVKASESQTVKPTVEVAKKVDDTPVVLESSDEDEVVEVALPPKPTITIESSDEDELQIVKTDSPAKAGPKADNKSDSSDRPISASPVPSVVSSVSDDFIRGDCIALNISSRKSNNPSFDFSLHGSDLLIQDTPKKKKKKKSKDAVTSTPIIAEKPANKADACFATPKSKVKNKNDGTKTLSVAKNSVSSADIYDSDSNQSTIDLNKNQNPYIVTDKSLPCVDVYDSDSSQSEIIINKNTNTNSRNTTAGSINGATVSNNKTSKSNDSTIETLETLVDLTGNDGFVTLDTTGITENIVMGNVTGFTESDDYEDESGLIDSRNDISKYVSSKEPSILNDDLDFDNLKGINKVCKSRRYSLTTLRAEMEKFYNESWGGEDFNHREIQKNMSRDKSLWAIDPKDRLPSMGQRKVRCNYCNRIGHRDETCRAKPPVCYMCGKLGHVESRCPSKICVNCGSPNHMYTNVCRVCCAWGRVTCGACGQRGHPASHCPDAWRRYHNTIDLTAPLEACFQLKKSNQLFCSGCSRRGHLVHACRTTLPFSGLPINAPHVFCYNPIYPQTTPKKKSQDNTVSSANTPNKRQSKSPTTHEAHSNKKRNVSATDDSGNANVKTTINAPKNAPINEVTEDKSKKVVNKPEVTESKAPEKAADYIPLGASNHDDKGHMIQDNEVSDTSDVVTSARIYVTEDVIDKLKTKEGADWLTANAAKLNVTVENSEITSFLNIKGKLGDQEAFQTELRQWTQAPKDNNTSNDNNESLQLQIAPNSLAYTIPKKKVFALKVLEKAFNSLNSNFGDPKSVYKELTYSQNRHEKLLRQKVINPTVLTHSRTHINEMLKKLNIMLIGQAGLANGTEHVNELYALKQRISSSESKKLSISIRKEIGELFFNIFGANPRDDYSELIQKYYSKSPNNKKFNSIPTQRNTYVNETKEITTVAENKNKLSQQLNKLLFYQKKLQRVKPNEPNRKKAKIELIRRLHSLIGMMFRKETFTSKIFKRVIKTQNDAQKFLMNL